MLRFSPALLAVSALIASGCGAEAVPPEDVAAAGETTKAAGTARIETVTRFEFSGQSHEFRTTRVVDYVHNRSQFVVEPSGCHTILIDEASYAEVPPAEGLPPGKRWVRHGPDGRTTEQIFEESLEPSVDSEGVTSQTIIMFAEPQPEPADYLDSLRGISGELELVGHEDVRGVATTRYRTTIDTLLRTRKGLEEEGWKPANIERYLATLQPTTEELDVWIDEDGRVRRTVTSWVPSGWRPGRSVTTTEYFDFGLEVNIEPPPAREVMNEEEWQRVADARLRAAMEDAADELGKESAALPGGFDATEPVSPPSCLH